MDSDEAERSRVGERDAEDRALLSAIARRDATSDKAMAVLRGRYHPVFKAYLRKLRLGSAEIDDALQEVWLDVARKAGTFTPRAPVKHWLWGFVTNQGSEAWRERARWEHRRVAANDGDEAAEDVRHPSHAEPDETRCPAQGAGVEHELAQCVQRAFAAFKRSHPREAMWLYLRHLGDWDIAQIARYRDSTPGAARQFLSGVRQLFRPYVAPCLDLLPG